MSFPDCHCTECGCLIVQMFWCYFDLIWLFFGGEQDQRFCLGLLLRVFQHVLCTVYLCYSCAFSLDCCGLGCQHMGLLYSSLGNDEEMAKYRGKICCQRKLCVFNWDLCVIFFCCTAGFWHPFSVSSTFSVLCCLFQRNIATTICQIMYHLNSSPPYCWFTSHSAFTNFMQKSVIAFHYSLLKFSSRFILPLNNFFFIYVCHAHKEWLPPLGNCVGYSTFVESDLPICLPRVGR